MCGIVGLFLKNRALEPELGAMLGTMLSVMSDRGPDSAGFAIYGAGDAGHIKLTLRSTMGVALDDIADRLTKRLGVAVPSSAHANHLIVSVPRAREQDARHCLAGERPDIHVVGAGTRMELYKDVGLPSDVVKRFGLPKLGGRHGIGHTRMATESAVTTDGAHPFSTGPDQCLVHNGSLSNHKSVRRMLERDGLRLETENDSEVAAAYLTWRMGQGANIEEALEASLADLDGFYTFVVGDDSGFAVLRDPISCKPAVMAETDDYVAFGSEYRALVDLPDIARARVFEPEPATVYAWNHV